MSGASSAPPDDTEGINSPAPQPARYGETRQATARATVPAGQLPAELAAATWRMKVNELKQALQAADPAVLLVAPHLLERLIQNECKLSAFHWQVPHRSCYVIDRSTLFHHIEPDELDLPADRLLPPTVILIARPTSDELNSQERDAAFLKHWRLLFHSCIHRALQQLRDEGKLPASEIQARIEEIGRTEFEEIRAVLDQDGYLLPPADDSAVYVEFAAVWLELRYFARYRIANFFPGIRDPERIDRLLARDVDAEGLFPQTRLAGAADPNERPTPRDQESEYYWKLVDRADQSALAGNTVRAAILRTRAARVAPAALAASTRAQAEAEMSRLAVRLKVALQLSDAEAGHWHKVLPLLLDKADQGIRPVEAALLFDLQTVCQNSEREIFSLDLVEWLLSGGKRPIKRPLPNLRLVRVARQLHTALQRADRVRLPDGDRQHLTRLMATAVRRSEEQFRDRFEPLLTHALQDVGLKPRNPPEETAFQQVVAQLLDRITSHGFFSFSDLRDTVSRNQLKLPDLVKPQDFIRGDPLLRLDRRLAVQLDGVYRRSEFYLRWLQRGTSLSFGTGIGRWLWRYVMVPFGGALLILELFQILLAQVSVQVPLFGPLSIGLAWWLSAEATRPQFPITGSMLFLMIGAFLLSLRCVPAVQETCRRAGRFVVQGMRRVFVDFPAWVWRVPVLRRFLQSWPFQLFWWYLFKPLVICGLLWWSSPDVFGTWLGAASSFLAANFLINSRLGEAVHAALWQGIGKLYELIRAGLLPGLVRLVVRLFKQVLDVLESILFYVDEWLRFHSGDRPGSMVVRTLIGFFWFPISYLARFYMVVLIEPGINPLKAPVSYLTAKIIYPLTGTIAQPLIAHLDPSLATAAMIWLVVVPTLWLLPDAFGFLFWEIKENWSLYRSNRSTDLQPAAVGPHGETIRQLLAPGFHSGTIPKLFARVRHAERQAESSGDFLAINHHRNDLKEVERAIERFVSREFVSLLHQSPLWNDRPLEVGGIWLSCNRIGIDLRNRNYPAECLGLEWAWRAGWITAQVHQPGWLDHLSGRHRLVFTVALAGLYKLAGVQLVREQFAAGLPPEVSGFDVVADGIVVWLDQPAGRSTVFYHWLPQKGQLQASGASHGSGDFEPPTGPGSDGADRHNLDAGRCLFACLPLRWDQWVEFWQQECRGGEPSLLGPLHEVPLLGSHAMGERKEGD